MVHVIEVQELTKYFPVQKSMIERILSRREEYVRAVDGVTFGVGMGTVFTLAGESGSGKTTTGRLMVRLLEPTSGRIIFGGTDISALRGEELRKIRRRMQIIFQDPYASLDPRKRIGDAVGAPLRIHGIAEDPERKRLVLEMLEKVGLTPAEQFHDLYPRALSGGQRQRVAIARSMILHPDFVVADEPVSMIDVSLRASILELMLELKEELKLTYLFITHDLAVAKYISDSIAIMYLGKIVELATKDELFNRPRHPYAMCLLSAIPIPDPDAKRDRLIPKGELPSPVNPPSGCRFHPRCPYSRPECSTREPPLEEITPGHQVACFFADEF